MAVPSSESGFMEAAHRPHSGVTEGSHGIPSTSRGRSLHGRYPYAPRKPRWRRAPAVPARRNRPESGARAPRLGCCDLALAVRAHIAPAARIAHHDPFVTQQRDRLARPPNSCWSCDSLGTGRSGASWPASLRSARHPQGAVLLVRLRHPGTRVYQADRYFICDYLQMREWVLAFSAPRGNTHHDHSSWRCNLRLYSGERIGCFRWGDEPVGTDEQPGRVFEVDNLATIVVPSPAGRHVGSYGAGGESAAHRLLKLRVADHRLDFGLSAAAIPRVEYPFTTGDRVDVMFKNHLRTGPSSRSKSRESTRSASGSTRP